jgi:hypothetical protein
VWAPATSQIVVENSRDDINNVNFVGSFGFSNFQPTYQLNGNNFPELSNFDLANPDAYVHLKVYTIDPSNSSSQNLLYLGLISSAENLSIEISLPLEVDKVYYQIYDAFGQVLDGFLLLAELSG